MSTVSWGFLYKRARLSPQGISRFCQVDHHIGRSRVPREAVRFCTFSPSPPQPHFLPHFPTLSPLWPCFLPAHPETPVTLLPQAFHQVLPSSWDNLHSSVHKSCFLIFSSIFKCHSRDGEGASPLSVLSHYPLSPCILCYFFLTTKKNIFIFWGMSPLFLK